MFEECAVLPGGEILQLDLCDGMHYMLSLKRGPKILLAYQCDGRRHSRTVRGRESAYEFKSVEKLRYDFERDAEDAARQG